jgi:7,8-dihydropterin-6-yl-methyl-4-(beta-D-ribofuranosyl)aminobenzene 5'-phosphate synthase
MKRIVGVISTLPLLALLFAGPAASQPGAQGRKIGLTELPRVSVTVLVENRAGDPSVLGEWGLSFFIETGRHRILIDAGAGHVLLGNARALGVDLGKTEAIVISHGHSDHTGGLPKALEACGPVDLFVHPGAFETRYWKESSRVTKEEMPLSRQELRGRVRRLVETKEPTLVCDGVMVTGQIPRLTDFEDTGVREHVFLDEKLTKPDPILDDQAVFFRVPEGIVVLLGCGHAGVVNTMRYVSKLLGDERIHAVIGGTHLLGASSRRMRETSQALKQFGVQKIMLSHCTGLEAYAEFAGAFPGRCSWPASGTRVHFGR